MIMNDRQRSRKKVPKRQRAPINSRSASTQSSDFDDHCRSLGILGDRSLDDHCRSLAIVGDRSIVVLNRQRRKAVDLQSLQRTAEQALALCLPYATSRPFPQEVAVILVSDRRITGIHRRFMQINEPTDVITFQHGEIFISVDSAERFGRAYHRTIWDEVQLYLVHGLLHLAGFDDRTAKQAEQMRRLQEQIESELRKQSELRV
jgi:probable rRNA maturation factor